ncbi:MAG: iron ABC transporter permease [Bacteroidales bacterium]
MSKSLIATYKIHRWRRIGFLIAIVCLLMMISFYAFTTGGSNLNLADFLKVFISEDQEMARHIFLNIRLPRILAAIVTGIALATSGVVMQVILRNPLASPYTLGISSSAAFGAALAIVVFGVGSSVAKTGDVFYYDNPYIITLFSFGTSLLGLFFILFISRQRKASSEIIILAGIIISSLFGAGIAALQYIADKVQLSTIVFWSFGDLGRANWSRLLIVSVVCIPIFIYFYFNRWNYKVLRSGDEYAASLGVNATQTRRTALICCTLCTAIVVSFFGVIAFVGLVVPHIVRTCIGNNEEHLIPISAISGGAFLLLCDTLGRSLFSPIVIPVGIITSFVGVPIFLFLLLRNGLK